MNYSEIQRLCDEKRITIGEVAEHIGMTYQGMKSSLNNEKISADKLIMLCNYLKITPNQFFHIQEEQAPYTNIHQTGAINMQQNKNDDGCNTELLKEQLRIKDKQIEQLLNLLKKQ